MSVRFEDSERILLHRGNKIPVMYVVVPKTNDLFKRDLVLGYEILIYIHGLCSEYLLHAWF